MLVQQVLGALNEVMSALVEPYIQRDVLVFVILILNRLEQVKLNIVLIIVLIQVGGEVAHSLEICK